jgi:hypothetical protein
LTNLISERFLKKGSRHSGMAGPEKPTFSLRQNQVWGGLIRATPDVQAVAAGLGAR